MSKFTSDIPVDALADRWSSSSRYKRSHLSRVVQNHDGLAKFVCLCGKSRVVVVCDICEQRPFRKPNSVFPQGKFPKQRVLLDGRLKAIIERIVTIQDKRLQ